MWMSIIHKVLGWQVCLCHKGEKISALSSPIICQTHGRWSDDAVEEKLAPSFGNWGRYLSSPYRYHTLPFLARRAVMIGFVWWPRLTVVDGPRTPARSRPLRVSGINTGSRQASRHQHYSIGQWHDIILINLNFRIQFNSHISFNSKSA